MSGYSTAVRPVSDYRDSVSVDLSLTLVELLDMVSSSTTTTKLDVVLISLDLPRMLRTPCESHALYVIIKSKVSVILWHLMTIHQDFLSIWHYCLLKDSNTVPFKEALVAFLSGGGGVRAVFHSPVLRIFWLTKFIWFDSS